MNNVGKHRKQYSALKERLGQAAAHKASNGFDFPDQHRGPDTAGLRSRSGDPGDPQISKNVPAQIPYCIFPDPTSIYVDDEFGHTLNEYDTCISGAQSQHELKGSSFNEIVDRPALDLQWCDFEQECHDRQDYQRKLVRPAYCENITKNGIGQAISDGRHHCAPATPSGLARADGRRQTA